MTYYDLCRMISSTTETDLRYLLNDFLNDLEINEEQISEEDLFKLIFRLSKYFEEKAYFSQR